MDSDPFSVKLQTFFEANVQPNHGGSVYFIEHRIKNAHTFGIVLWCSQRNCSLKKSCRNGHSEWWKEFIELFTVKSSSVCRYIILTSSFCLISLPQVEKKHPLYSNESLGHECFLFMEVSHKMKALTAALLCTALIAFTGSWIKDFTEKSYTSKILQNNCLKPAIKTMGKGRAGF